MSERRYWQVVNFGWGADDGNFDKNQDNFLAKYFPGRKPIHPAVLGRSGSGLFIVASEEEIAFCEFDCSARFREVLQYA